jgi:hypothetical protein
MDTIGLRPMHRRPEPGQPVIVQMRSGQQIDCTATRVIGAGIDGIIIYHRGRAIDESTAAGWWPAPRRKP